MASPGIAWYISTLQPEGGSVQTFSCSGFVINSITETEAHRIREKETEGEKEREGEKEKNISWR